MKNIITILIKLIKFLKDNTSHLIWIALSVVYLSCDKQLDQVIFLNVGQGDATLVQIGNHQILIDAGAGIDVVSELPKYMGIKDRTIEVLIITHPHDDHLVGVFEVLKRYNVGEIWLYPVCYSSRNYKALLTKGVNIKEISKGMKYAIKGIQIEVVWPLVTELNKCSAGKYRSWDGNINNDSIVILLQYFNKRILLMGDAEIDVESKINIVGEIDILKAGHHCSRTSSSETFLKRTNPSIAICSCGKENKFGHPDSGTLKSFSSLNVQYFVTYVDGSIVIR